MTPLFIAAAAASSAQPAPTLGVGAMLEMLLWLGVVIALILACAWAYRRLGGGVLATAGIIKVRSIVSVGSRERIALVQVGDKQILVGICPGRIDRLHVFDGDVIGSDFEQTAPQPDFVAKLQSLLKRDGDK